MAFVDKTLFATYPLLETYCQRVSEISGLKEYLTEKDNCQRSRQLFNKRAKINNNVSYTLHYFSIYVRGEPIRMLLNHANIPFKNQIIEFAEWPALKP